MLSELLAHLPADQEISSVTAAGAYHIRKYNDANANPGADAVISPPQGPKAMESDTAGAVARDEALWASKYVNRAL
jgi:hypothetical protein